MLKKIFTDLLAINSPSGEEAEVASYIQKFLRSTSSFVIFTDESNNIIARTKLFNPKKGLLLTAHMDTIESTENLKYTIDKNRIVKSSGRTILGADNKAAIAQILTAVDWLQQCGKLRDLELVFCVKEETGMVGSRRLRKSSLKSKHGLALDYSRPVGYIVKACAGAVLVDVEITGRSAHGALVNEGLNAIVLAAKAISAFDYLKKRTDVAINIGTLHAGTAVNTVPERAHVSFGIRGFDLKTIKKYLSIIEKNFNGLKKLGAKVSIRERWVGEPYSHSAKDPLIKSITAFCKKNKLSVHMDNSHGLSDANSFNRLGIKVVEVGYGVQKVHTHHEIADLNDMERVVAMITELTTKNA